MFTHKLIYTFIICFFSYSIFSQELIAHYNFNENLIDSSANNFDGEAIIAANFNSEGDALVIENHTENGVKLNHSILNGKVDFTVIGFLKINGFNSNNNLISSANSFMPNEFIIGYNSVIGDFTEEGWHLRVRDDFYYFQEDLRMDDLENHCLGIVREGNKVNLFLDGQQIGEAIQIHNDPLNIGQNGFILGQDQDCLGSCFDEEQNWHGEVNDLRFYDGAMSQIDLRNLCISYTIPVTTDVEEVSIPNFSVPNAFSPNQDNINDIFQVVGNHEINVTNFTIFNRWGNNVFQGKNNNGWDGNYNGKPAPSGVYVYIITIQSPNGQEKTIRGDITLIR